MNSTKWSDEFLVDVKLKYDCANTEKQYCSMVKLFLHAFSAYREPKEIPTLEIKKWLLEGKTINSRKHRLCAVKAFYRLTVHMPLKIDRIEFPRSEKKKPQPLEETEIIALIKACSNLKHKTIIYLMYGGGLRISEAINLKWSHFDRAGGVINIISAKGKKDRSIPLTKELIQIFTDYYKKYKTKDYVFTGQSGKPKYSASSVREFLIKYATEAGIRAHVHPHKLRRSYTTHLHDNYNIDVYDLAKLLGHNSIRTTQGYIGDSKKHIASLPSPLSNIPPENTQQYGQRAGA